MTEYRSALYNCTANDQPNTTHTWTTKQDSVTYNTAASVTWNCPSSHLNHTSVKDRQPTTSSWDHLSPNSFDSRPHRMLKHQQQLIQHGKHNDHSRISHLVRTIFHPPNVCHGTAVRMITWWSLRDIRIPGAMTRRSSSMSLKTHSSREDVILKSPLNRACNPHRKKSTLQRHTIEYNALNAAAQLLMVFKNVC